MNLGRLLEILPEFGFTNEDIVFEHSVTELIDNPDVAALRELRITIAQPFSPPVANIEIGDIAEPVVTVPQVRAFHTKKNLFLKCEDGRLTWGAEYESMSATKALFLYLMATMHSDFPDGVDTIESVVEFIPVTE